MTESPNLVNQPKVRDLISMYESNERNATTAEILIRPTPRSRAKSVGNLLHKKFFNVISLSDIEWDLNNIEAYLKQYNVYNKKNHVAIQEQLFNILSNIVNIDEGDASLKTELIHRTQRLVSVLNSKLPQEKFESKSIVNGDSKYVPYTEFIRQSKKEPPTTEKVSSVSSLRANFEKNVENTPVKQNSYHPEKEERNEVTDNIEANHQYSEIDGITRETPNSEQPIKSAVSVSKLRNLFEEKSRENPQGLEILAKPSVPSFHRSMGNIPYTERNLGNVRFQRTISGNYMSYNGLLRSADISRSKSTNDLSRRQEDKTYYNKPGRAEEYNSQKDDSSDDEAESEETLTDREEKTLEEEEDVFSKAQISAAVEVPIGHSVVSHTPATEQFVTSTPEEVDVKKESVVEMKEPAKEQLVISSPLEITEEVKIEEEIREPVKSEPDNKNKPLEITEEVKIEEEIREPVKSEPDDKNNPLEITEEVKIEEEIREPVRSEPDDKNNEQEAKNCLLSSHEEVAENEKVDEKNAPATEQYVISTPEEVDVKKESVVETKEPAKEQLVINNPVEITEEMKIEEEIREPVAGEPLTDDDKNSEQSAKNNVVSNPEEFAENEKVDEKNVFNNRIPYEESIKTDSEIDDFEDAKSAEEINAEFEKLMKENEICIESIEATKV